VEGDVQVSRGIVTVGALATFAVGLNPAVGVTELPLSLCSPRENTFTTAINNPYLPMTPGQKSTFFGFEDLEPLGLKISVLDQTENLYKGKRTIVTRVVEEVEWVDESEDGVLDDGENLIEVSRNYFAQVASGPNAGTVCYFGEEVEIYEDGVFSGDTSGSWRADKGKNAPGIFMPATPTVGQFFQTEAAPGVAEDTAEIVDIHQAVHVPAGTFPDVIEVEDCNPLEDPVECGTKYYAPGQGLIIDGPVELTDF